MTGNLHAVVVSGFAAWPVLHVYSWCISLSGAVYLHSRNHACMLLYLPVQIEEGLCQLLAMLWLDSQDWWAKAHGQYQETLLSYLGYQIRTDTSEVCLLSAH